MTDYHVGKEKHLTLDARLELQLCLDHGMTFKAIGRRIGKDPTTVSKEVKKHLTARATNYVIRDEQGKELPPPICPRLLKAPFVCNPCHKRHHGCRLNKQFYLARHAQKAYEETLSEARTGIALNHQAFYDHDRVISEGIRNGQHLYHILKTHNLGVSASTVYRYVKKGYLSIAAIDLPRMVKFKPRRKRPPEYVPAAFKIGRCYDDFECFRHQRQLSSARQHFFGQFVKQRFSRLSCSNDSAIPRAIDNQGISECGGCCRSCG